MKTVRTGVFETNSSSVHAISIVTEDEFEKWKEGKGYSDICNNYILSKKELAEKISDKPYSHETYEGLLKLGKEEFDEIAEEYGYYTYDMFYYVEYETYESEYTSPKGEKLVAFGYFGRNG